VRLKSTPVLWIVVALLLGTLVGVGSYAFIYAKGYSYLQNDPIACANCHAMRTQYDGWVKSSHHFAATCNDCHTPANVAGKYAVKASNGFFHSMYFTTGRYPDTIRITNFDLGVTEAACRRCHQDITQAINGNVAHNHAQGMKCTRCHYSVGHSNESAWLNLQPLELHHGK
jgi:cytochrome c nitrite reductase small subunit